MGEIKSAAEIAREKLEKIGEPTEEERLTWKYVPEGEKLAVLYIRENQEFAGELNRYDEKAKKYVVKGMTDILARNITLPRNDALRRTNKRAMDALKVIKKDKVALENVFSRIRHVLEHYSQNGEKQKEQAYESLKAEFEEKVQEALRQQTGISTRVNVDVERQPQFQEEWRKVQSQLDAQYTKLLDEYRQELVVIE